MNVFLENLHVVLDSLKSILPGCRDLVLLRHGLCSKDEYMLSHTHTQMDHMSTEVMLHINIAFLILQ